jgi:hypothetical protein
MFFLTLFSLHQGLALGAAGLLICAISDVGPAIKAVRSRFAKLAPGGAGDRGGGDANTDSKSNSKAIKTTNKNVDVRLQVARRLARSRSFKKAASAPPASSGPILSIKSVRRAVNIPVPRVGGTSLGSDVESWSTECGPSDSDDSSVYSSSSSSCSIPPMAGASQRLSASASIRKGLAVVAAGARAHTPAWARGGEHNVVVGALVLVLGLLQLALVTLSSGAAFPLPRSRRAAAPTAILDGDAKGDELL